VAEPLRLPWREVEGASVALPPPVELYRDSLPLADVHVAPSGATCCLRRIPEQAELLVWEGAMSGGSAFGVAGACLFSAGEHQTAESAVLAAVSAAGVRQARLQAPLRDFALDRASRRIQYRTFRGRHAIVALAVGALLP
jgi:hypothetical protein